MFFAPRLWGGCNRPYGYASPGKNKTRQKMAGLAYGGEEEIRTLDPRVANAMLYQLSYFPELFDKF